MYERNVERKVLGTVQAIVGGFKRAFGRLMGHERMEVAGRADELRGRSDIDRGMRAERREGTMEEAAGALERKAGEVMGNERISATGRASELEGRARREANRPSPNR